MAAADCLLDTGPLVALLHADDRHHAACAGFLRSFRGRFLTTEAVLTEALALLSDLRGGGDAVLQFFLRGGAVLVPQSRRSLERARDLLSKYGDLPMDFADATLVSLAEEAGLPDVFTLDRRGFRVYCWSGKRGFRLHPAPE